MAEHPISTVLFDCDGVLVDSLAANTATYQNVLEAAGYPRPSADAVRSCFNLTGEDAIKSLSGTGDTREIERIAGFLSNRDLRATHLIKPISGILPVLSQLHSEYQLGIVTSRSLLGMNDVFEEVPMQHLFATIITREDYERPKPHPEPILVALSRLGRLARQAAYIGDSTTDIGAANAAGATSVYLGTEHHPDADICIADVRDLPGVLTPVRSR